ncbi:MAG: flagellar hook assembly protein FlgD [Acidimicrobiia bacterium]
MSDIAATGPTQSISTLDALRAAKDKSTGASTLDKNAFLKLLVAQLKYQNPMDPSDPTQFMAQTAQFTMVEKLENMDATTQVTNTNQRLALATGLIGKQVTYNSGTDGMKTGLVGSARVTTDGTLLRIGTTEITLDMIDTVAAPPAATTPATTTTPVTITSGTTTGSASGSSSSSSTPATSS